jgi:hypothetical protein
VKIIMSLKTRFARVFSVLAGLALVAAGWCRAGDGQLAATAQTQVDSSIKDSATIDVSQYPTGIRENYKVFSRKCAQCHSLSRPINSDYVLPNEWSRCIGHMKRRSGADIGSFEEKKIYDFLVYDSSVRKREQLTARLQALNPGAQKEVEGKIKEVADKYQPTTSSHSPFTIHPTAARVF